MASRDLLNRLPAPVRWLALPAALLGCTAWMVTAWGGDPDVPAPSQDAETARYCAALHAALPAEVLGHPRRDPSPASPYTAAWGSSPRTVMTCGADRPDLLNDTDRKGPCVDEVGWGLTEDGAGGYRFATGMRKAYVVVEVPAGAYPNYADPLGSFSDAIRATVPRIDGTADSDCLDDAS
ncbi:DUF3515 domain-containing protein [Kitasatospora cineracea]|uniref:Uncharacterized protein DUF3515 n=1 Tax=Kitasatospora cineracea TaxID=88074 RepID=A0A8G1UDG1_9ACTN|nr:DUF3515 domain-containing protein [Kitasatospora cineracea]ROR41966.1 uncharacterized protein DUF3515 [Kitasatospora cineracea]